MTRRKKYSGGNLTTHINYGAKLLSYCKSESCTKTNVSILLYTYIAPQNFRSCAWQRVPLMCFKICHTVNTYMESQSTIFHYFGQLLFFLLMNVLVSHSHSSFITLGLHIYFEWFHCNFSLSTILNLRGYVHTPYTGGGDINGLICSSCVAWIKTIVFLDTMCFSLIFCT